MKKRESNRQLCRYTSRQTRTVCCVHTREHCSFMGRSIHQDVMPAYWPWLVHTEFMTCPAPPCLHSCSSGQKDTAECQLWVVAVHDCENKRVHFLAADSALQAQHKNFLKGRKKCSEEHPGAIQ